MPSLQVIMRMVIMILTMMSDSDDGDNMPSLQVIMRIMRVVIITMKIYSDDYYHDNEGEIRYYREL